MRNLIEVFKTDNTVGVLFLPLLEREVANQLATSINECLGIPLAAMNLAYRHEWVNMLAIQGVTKKKVIEHIRDKFPEYRVISTVRRG